MRWRPASSSSGPSRALHGATVLGQNPVLTPVMVLRFHRQAEAPEPVMAGSLADWVDDFPC